MNLRFRAFLINFYIDYALKRIIWTNKNTIIQNRITAKNGCFNF